MNTRIVCPNEETIQTAGEILRNGGTVIFPTETVYGLGANALDETAAAKIFAAKMRPADNPLIVHIADLSEMAPLVRQIPEEALLLAERFWPGPLTMILPKADCIPVTTSGGLDTVGIRMPADSVAQSLIRAAGVPIAAPSANLSGRPSPTTAQHVIEDMDGRVDMILAGHDAAVGLESTVVELVGDMVRILRPGGITFEMLAEVVGEDHVEVDANVLRPATGVVRSPGMKYRHYAPKAPLTAVCGTPDATAEKIASMLAAAKEREPQIKYAVLCYEEYLGRFGCPCVPFGKKDDHLSQACRLFDALRAFDTMDCDRILAQCPDTDGVGLAVVNRLKRAAGFSCVDA